MAVVLVDPPAVAQPDAQVAEQDAGYIVGPPGAENLPVPGVVAQEPDLGEDHRQEHGHRQLPPRVARHDKTGPSGGQQPDRDRDLPGVAARPPLQQTRFLDLPGQLRVLAAAPRRRRRGGQLDLPAHGSAVSEDRTGNSWTHIAAGLVMSRRGAGQREPPIAQIAKGLGSPSRACGTGWPGPTSTRASAKAWLPDHWLAQRIRAPGVRAARKHGELRPRGGRSPWRAPCTGGGGVL